MGFREQHIQLVNTELRCVLEPWSTTGRLSREALGFKKTKKIDSRASVRPAAASFNRISVSIHFSAGSFGPVRLHRQSERHSHKLSHRAADAAVSQLIHSRHTSHATCCCLLRLLRIRSCHHHLLIQQVGNVNHECQFCSPTPSLVFLFDVVHLWWDAASVGGEGL